VAARVAIGATFPLTALLLTQPRELASPFTWALLGRPLAITLVAAGAGALGWLAFRPLAFAGRRLAASVLAALVAESLLKYRGLG
jgi:hypothetical protein